MSEGEGEGKRPAAGTEPRGRGGPAGEEDPPQTPFIFILFFSGTRGEPAGEEAGTRGKSPPPGAAGTGGAGAAGARRNRGLGSKGGGTAGPAPSPSPSPSPSRGRALEGLRAPS